MKDTILVIKTDKGDMRVKLYDETPQHRDNFVKLAGEGFFDSLDHSVLLYMFADEKVLLGKSCVIIINLPNSDIKIA